MKLKGVKLDAPNQAFAIIPRAKADGTIEDHIFIAQAVLDYAPFMQLCPEPKPRWAEKPGGVRFQNIEDPEYKEKMLAWYTARQNWMIIESLKATPDLEWETVKPADSTTWGNFINELKEAKFIIKEINLITDCVFEANSLDDDKLNQARERFLQSRLPVAKS